jgi:hypothetical protein
MQRAMIYIGAGMLLRQYFNLSPILFLVLAGLVALRERFWAARAVD